MNPIMYLLPVALLLVTSPDSRAEAVYRWVDDEGVTHFSATPPAATATGITRLDLAPVPSPATPDDYYSVVNQARRMEQSRLDAMAARTAQLQAEAEAERARATARAAAPAPASAPEVVYLPAWYHYPRHPRPQDWRDHARHHPRPAHEHDRRPWPVRSLKPPGAQPHRPH